MAAARTLRSLLSELRQASPSGSIKDSAAAQYILDQYRKHQTTDELLCKQKDEMLFLGKTYLCYIRSSREYKKINDEYKGLGERTVESTAKMVGFKLPHEPK